MSDQRQSNHTEDHVADLEVATADAEHVSGGAGQGKVSMNDLLAGHGGGGAGKVSMNDIRATRAGLASIADL